MQNGYTKEVQYFYRRNPAVRALVRRRRTVFLLKVVLIELLVFLAAYEIYRYGRLSAAIVTGCALAVVLPILLLQPWRTVGRGYLGEITEAKENMGYVAEKGVTAKRSDMHYRKLLFLTVREEKGRKYRLRLPALYAKVYLVGARVLFVRGLDRPIPLSPGTHTVCLFCGGRMPVESDHCAGCGANRMNA